MIFEIFGVFWSISLNFWGIGVIFLNLGLLEVLGYFNHLKMGVLFDKTS